MLWIIVKKKLSMKIVIKELETKKLFLSKIIIVMIMMMKINKINFEFMVFY